MKRFSLIVVSSLLAFTLMFGSSLINHANEAHAATIPHSTQPINKIVVSQNMLSSQGLQFIKKLQDSGLLKEFVLSKGHLALKSPLPVLKGKYHLSVSEIKEVQSMLAFDQQRQALSTSLAHQSTIKPQIWVNGTVLYFNHGEVWSLLAAAADQPVAMAAALDALATLFGGPVGSLIGLILNVVGIASLINFCYLVFQAEWDGTGVYMGILWTPWPNYTQGEW